jgi:hypothetical protein
MKKAVILACTLAFVSAVCVAQTPSVAPLSAQALAMILGQPAATGACPLPQDEAVFAARHPTLAKACSATVTCWDGSVKSCTYSGGGGTCTATQSNCSVGTRGSVNCNGTVTSCPQCPCGTPNCCTCDSTGDCVACCRCGGGGAVQCFKECGGF